MKREIKFRGIRLDNGKWVIGDLILIKGGALILPIGKGWDQHMVDAETVGQFTGLKDKDGRDIYEGDIIECFYMNLSYQQKGNYPPPNIEVEEYEVVRNVSVVKFEYGSFNFCGLPIGFDKLTGGECEHDYNTLNVRLKSIWDNNIDNIREEYPYLTVENFYNYNIIGNIYDNPDLLKTE